MNNNTTRFRNDSFTRVSTIQQEKETVEWLNASLKRCWKLFNDILQPEAMKILQKVIQDALEEERRPLLQSIDVESFELGGRSPLIFGVEALPTRSDTELVYEFDFRYDGDAKLLLLVRIGPFRRFCLHIPVIVSGLDVDATFRVHLRLTQEKPFIGDISLALVRQPRLSLVLKPFKIVDIMEVPGLRVFLRRLLTVEIPKRMVLPNRLIVFKLQPDSNIKRSILKKLSKKKKDYVGVVNILLYGAVSLVGTTTLGLSNPFCRITVADNTTRSKSDKNTSELGRKGDPVWNQQFEMLVRDPENDSILFEVMDRYGMRYRTIGTFEVMISSLVEGKNTELWVPLQESVGSDGRLHVSLYYRNFVDDISLFSESVDALYMNENEYSDGNASEALDKDIIEKNDGSLNEESNATTINGSI
ncbi:Synaptotagmin-1 [Galdieria sulphuraria]|nr:Synaptotagmin-1 [Galdieria sulphuraria]